MTIDPKFSHILFQDSPFISSIDLKSCQEIMENINHGVHPAVIISLILVGNMAATIDLINTESEWLKTSFRATEEDLDFFCLGLLTVPQLMFGTHLIQTLGVKSAVTNISMAASTPRIMRHNVYKAEHLPIVNWFYQPFVFDPKVTADPMYEHCRTQPFSNNIWFLAGIEASYLLFHEYAKLVNTN